MVKKGRAALLNPACLVCPGKHCCEKNSGRDLLVRLLALSRCRLWLGYLEG